MLKGDRRYTGSRVPAGTAWADVTAAPGRFANDCRPRDWRHPNPENTTVNSPFWPWKRLKKTGFCGIKQSNLRNWTPADDSQVDRLRKRV